MEGGNEDRKLDFRIKIWIKINMEKLKFDSLVIYMSAGEGSMKKRLMGEDFGCDSLKLAGLRKMILSDDDFSSFIY